MKKTIQSMLILAFPLLLLQGCGNREIKKEAEMNNPLKKMSIMKEKLGINLINKDVFFIP